jgi:diguanylate cyclase (GGDEF)-like protein/PAS domain S-box-containing protein
VKALPLSLKRLIPLVLVAFAILDAAFSLLYTLPRGEQRIRERLETQLRQEMEYFQGALGALFRRAELANVRRQVTHIGASDANRLVLVVSSDGRVLAASRLAWVGRPVVELPLPYEPALGRRARLEHRTSIRSSQKREAFQAYTYLHHPGIGGGHASDAVLFLERDWAGPLSEVRQSILGQALFSSLVLLGLAGLAWLGFRRLLTQRVNQLVAAGKRIEAGDLQARSGVQGPDELGRVGQAFDTTVDRLARVQTALAESEERYRGIINTTPEGFLIFDREHGTRDVNDALSHMLGLARESLLGRLPEELVIAGERERFQSYMEQLEREGHATFEVTLRARLGCRVPTLFSASHFQSRDGRLSFHFAFVTNVAALKALEARLQKLASLDSLTSVYNRLRFEQALEAEIARSERSGEPFALLMFDLDHFKRVNDTYGHHVGDQVLKGVVRAVRSRLRAVDMLARWGGEEFMVLAPETDAEGGRALAERIRREVGDTDLPGPGTVTISIGVTVYAPGDDPDALVHRVDEALYRAKEGGRDRVEWEMAGPGKGR